MGDEAHRQVSAAEASAQASSREAADSWQRFVRAVQDNSVDLVAARRDLEAAIAQHGYAWAVFHATVADCSAEEPDPPLPS